MHQTRNKKSRHHSAKPPMSSFLLPVLLLSATAATADDGLAARPGCQALCGGVEIPYPFGIGTSCSRKGFEVDCINNGNAGQIPVLANTDKTIQVLHLSVWPFPVARVLNPVAYKCFNSTGYDVGSSPGGANFNPEGVYRVSNTTNELYVLGCNTLAYVEGEKNGGSGFSYKSYTGCVAAAGAPNDPQDDACAGVGCCHVNVPAGITDSSVTWDSWSRAGQEFCPCDYAFIVERGNYTFKASDLLSTHIPNNQTMPLQVDWTMPLRLDWAIRDNGSTTDISCAQAPNKPDRDYACRSNHSECVDSTNGPGYFCNCTKGYEGNPYILGGCANINECIRPDEFPCHGECKDTDGSYECKCRPGYDSDGDPKEKPCLPKLSGSEKRVIGITVGASILFLIVLGTGVCYMLKRIKQKAKERELKAMEREQQAKEREEQAKKRELEAIARKNGSERLKNVKTLLFFTNEELDKITNNNEKLLGKGFFGEVHKGTLSDHTEVAVKNSIEVTSDTLDKFVKEVEIQSRMMHKNILKLLGCCLQVNVPLLVYEYAAKGSLEDILHGKKNNMQREPLPLRSRLDIAIGSAQGLAYMHSYTENGIQHADVKPGNILLDGGLVPKISDFGLSKVFVEGKNYTNFVIGCEPYMDPVYKNRGKITPKSDVYSFGIVLLELISRKPVLDGEDSLVNQFKSVYEKDTTGKVLFDKDITDEQDIHILDEIGKLAMKCLHENVNVRPAMVSVASALVILKDSWEEKVLGKKQDNGSLLVQSTS